MPPSRSRRRQHQQRQRVERPARPRRGITRANPTPTHNDAVDTSVPVSATQAPDPAPVATDFQLSDGQIRQIADQVTAQISSQITAPQSIMPIYDVNKRGNYPCIDIDEESDDDLHNVSIANELGINVPNKIKLKIVSDEYVDLASLLIKTANTDNSEKILQVKNGQILLQTKKSSDKIDSIDKWTDAFLVFMSIYVQAHPSSATNLIKYMSNVRLGANRTKDLGFKSYDEQFRIKKAKNPSMDWGTVDNELWLLYMYQTTSRSTYNNDKHPSAVGKCFDYNFKAFCQRKRCNYLHKCAKCDGPHPSVKCFSKSSRILNFRSDQGQRGDSKRSADQQGNKKSGHN
ncbi:hypothetical protein FSP39_009871 [Pinctada imbricata]|uniref:C3H1-type domain-containing protein n=1 Tax=Pinctada imbricata TaxID=66713 RepID=A0AA88YFZ1_PINIB|nr:hypothetical protein FSP39_009871 [Pinctada imbricata]